MSFDYVSSDTARTYATATAEKDQKFTLLWGDRVEVLEVDDQSGRDRVRARE